MPNDSLSFWELIGKDIERYLYFSSDFLSERKNIIRKISVFLTPCLLCCFFYRLSHVLFKQGWHRLAGVVAGVNLLFHKTDISPTCEIGAGLYIPHTVGVVLNGHAGRNLTLYAFSVIAPLVECIAADGSGGRKDRPRLGDNVILGTGSVILGNVRVGDDVIVGTKVMVLKDIPAKAKLYTPFDSTYMLKSSARS